MITTSWRNSPITAPVIGKRDNTRFQVLNCRVQLKSNGVLGLFGKETHQLSLINLSAAGMQAISSKILKHQREYDITIVAPAFHQPISAKGRVVWHKPYTANDQKQYYQIGFEFTYWKGQALKKIEELEYNPKLREIVRN